MRRFVILLALLLASLAANAYAQTLVTDFTPAYESAVEQYAPIQGLLRLYLRVAGVVWVLVEWVAALLLWRGYNRLRHHMQPLDQTE